MLASASLRACLSVLPALVKKTRGGFQDGCATSSVEFAGYNKNLQLHKKKRLLFD